MITFTNGTPKLSHHTTAADPWAGTDHDPLSWTQPPPTEPTIAMTAGRALAFARDDIHAAAESEGEHRCGYAMSARDNAVTVLLDPSSTRRERACAEHYLVEAEAIIANTNTARQSNETGPRLSA
jgi:hypothetical protein